jgi:Aspartyl protease
MPTVSRFKLSAGTLTVSLLFGQSFPCAAADPSQPVRVPFHFADEFMIVVPVSVNGAGPYNFLLDTGSGGTVIDQALATSLHLAPLATGTVRGVLGPAKASIVQAGRVTLGSALGTAASGSASVANLQIFVRPKLDGLPSGVRGILGENFLASFDLLIDNRHHIVQLEATPGPLADSLTGERLPIGFPESSVPSATNGSLIVGARVGELGEAPVPLVLDSGSNALVMFGNPARFGNCAPQQHYFGSSGIAGISGDSALRTIHGLRFGAKVVSNLVAIVAARPTGFEIEGLVPTSLFHTVYISHSGNFVILDPRVKEISAPVPLTIADARTH